jgi:hypothetical protein
MIQLLLVISVISACSAVAFYCAHRIRVSRHLSAWMGNQLCFYLDERNAMDLYLQGDYPYLQRSVERTTRRNIVLEVLFRFLPIRGGLRRVAGEEQVTKYFEDAGPITVIGRIVRALDKENDIVYVDLINRTIAPNAGLDRALKSPSGEQAKRVDEARLRDLESAAFVSIEGRFKVTAKSEKTTTFSAPYDGPTESSGDQARVSVTCVNKHLRPEDVPDGAFRARCLGKISWDPDTGDLEISPVLAIFR